MAIGNGNGQRLSLSEILLSGGGGRSGPDWVALVKNEVAVILDDKDDILLGGGVRMPDGFVIVGVDDQVAICLHSDTLHVGALLFGVLPPWVAILVHDNFAVFLHSELEDAILTPQAVALEQPLIVTEGVVRVRHIE